MDDGTVSLTPVDDGSLGWRALSGSGITNFVTTVQPGIRTALGQFDAEHTTLAAFGTVARGTSTLDSDSDLVVVFPDNLDAHTIAQFVDALTAGAERRTGNSRNIFDVTVARLAELEARGNYGVTG